MRRTLTALVAAAALACAGAAGAEPNRASPRSTRAALDHWNDEFRRAIELSQDGRHKRARTVLTELIDDMVDRVGPGGNVQEVFARVVLQLALTEAALGLEEDAVWHWHVAVAIEPRFEKSDLGAFGDAGALLMRNPPSAEHRHPHLVLPDSDVEGVTAPKPLRAKPPKFPPGAQEFRIEGRLVVRVIVREDGSVSDPFVLEALPVPTLAWVALEALHDWRFAPATFDGEPAAVYYQLTVNYKLRR